MYIYGHRGAAGLKDENTLASINEALKYNIYGIEIDIHQCKSGELIVIHDDTVDRTTNSTGAVKTFTLSQLNEIKTINGFSIPTLKDVLSLLDGQYALNIELKSKNTPKPLLSLLAQNFKGATKWDYANVLISSFDYDLLEEVRRLNEHISIAILTESSIHNVLNQAKELGAKAIHPSIDNVDKEEINHAKNCGFEINVWTVNTLKQYALCKHLGVSSIFTDFPNLFV